MTDLSLISRPQPVLIHPLLQTLPYTKIGTNGENPQLKGGEEKDIESPQQFLDPLGAADGGTHQGSDYGTTDGKRFVQTSSTPVLGEAETGPLDNTLVQNDNEDWPLYELDSSEPQLVSFRPWREFRQLILNKFTTGETLDLQSSFLTKTKVVSQNGTNSNKKQQQLQQRHRISAAVAKEKKRQDYGNAPSSAQPTTFHDLCPEEWLHKLAELRKQLQLQWREERRLDCIKLISELLSQLSGNICSAQFYPAQFVHITNLLDYFGWLVWQRLFQLAQEERRKAQLGPLPSQWTINDVLGETRLKARNWFGKINQIVLNLTPRLYMLAAVLPCQRFMDPWPEAAQENMLELCRAARQIQHPLVSSYLRCYLCRVAMRVQPADRAPHWKCLNDWLQTYTQQPISLLWPAMEWIVQCVAYTACTYEDLHPMWEYCRRVDKRPMILVPMLNALPRLYLGEHALEACRIITSSELVTGDELCAFGRNLLEAQIPQPAHKPILRSVWKCILRLGSLKEYLACCECWCQFIVRHFTANEVHVVLENIMRKLQNDKCELFHHQLLAVLSKIFAQAREVRSLLGMEIFAKFFDIFRSAASPIRVEASKDVLSPLVAKHGVGTFTEIVSAYQILSVCQLLHDSTELSAPCDQMAGAIRLTSAALDRINLHSSPDQCLAFLVSCRAGLSNWDALQRYVIRRVQAFTLDITRSIRYTSSRAAFLQGCMANLFISIPSLSDPLDRIELAIQSAQIALAAMAFLHVDSFVDFTLDQFAEFTTKSLPNNFGPRLFRIGEYFLATLANIPQFNFSVDDVEDAQRQPGGEQQLMRHFQRFLDSVLNLQLSQSAQPNNDKLVQLFIRCLQYIFVLQSKQAQKKQSSTGISNDLDVQTNCWAFPPGNHFASNEDKTGHQLMEENAICLDLIEKITEAIEPPLLLGESESDEFCAIGMELLELVAQFGGDDLPPRLRALVKAVYKRCRRRPALARRVNRLKKRGTTEAESNRNAYNHTV